METRVTRIAPGGRGRAGGWRLGSHEADVLVVLVLGGFQAVGDQGFGGVGGTVQVEVEVLALGGGEVAEDEVGRVHPAGRPADAEANPVVVRGAERLGDRAQAVVAVVATAELEPQRAGRDVELVVDDHDPVGGSLVESGQRGNRAAGQVHIRAWHRQADRCIADTDLGDVISALMRLEPPAGPARQQRNDHGTGVMPVARILRAGIAQPGDYPAFGGQPDYSSLLDSAAASTGAGTSAPSATAVGSSACGASTCRMRVSGSTCRVVPRGSARSPACTDVPTSMPSISTSMDCGMWVASASTVI